MEFDISYTSKEIAPWGGMVFLKQMLQKIGFREQIIQCKDLPQPKSNRGHKVTTIIEAFVTSIWCGANRFMHTEVTRHDVALGRIFDWDEIPAQDAAKFTHPIQRVIHDSTNWILLDRGIEICEQNYQNSSWAKSRRMVIVRQRIRDRPKALGKQLSLFSEEEIFKNYRYSAYVTNMKLAPAEIWRLYRGRANAENRIKELKYDFGFDSFNLKDFFATESALIFAMIAYNLMSLFRTFVLQEKSQKTLSTLIYRTFAIGAYFEKQNDKLVLKIALNKKRRSWFGGLWNYSKTFNYPFEISNA